jgi:hypothetical protein
MDSRSSFSSLGGTLHPAIKSVVHDTAVVAAIKHNAILPSHQLDMERLERHVKGQLKRREVSAPTKMTYENV